MFPPMLIGAAIAGTASGLSLLHHYRQHLGPMNLRDVRLLARLAPTPIAESKAGIVKFVGKVGALTPLSGYYNREPCAVIELHHYEVVDTRAGARRVLARSERRHQKFWVEDDTGRIEIDPETARIDYQVEGADLESTVEEHKLRIGERVAVVGTVRRVGPKLTQPMRSASDNADSTIAFVGAPLVTWRSDPEVYPRLTPPMSGMALSAGSIGMAVLGSILNL